MSEVEILTLEVAVPDDDDMQGLVAKLHEWVLHGHAVAIDRTEANTWLIRFIKRGEP